MAETAPESPTPVFQIAVSGSTGLTIPSLKSTDLGETGFAHFTLANVCNKCNISNKLLFTADDTTSIDDATTLKYYMSLSAEGQAVLESTKVDAGNAGGENPAPASSPAPGPAPSPAPDRSAQPPVKESPNPKPGVPTFVVKVLGNTPSQAPMPDTTALKGILEQVSKTDFLKRDALPTIAKTDLAALKADYAATVSTTKFLEPAELQEAQWDTVFRNTRAFHGYYYDEKVVDSPSFGFVPPYPALFPHTWLCSPMGGYISPWGA